MRSSVRIGIFFGTTSGIITTLGLIVGLHSGTHSQLAIIGGVLTIAVADAFSDALGIHISEESEKKHSTKEIWESTLFTFLAKFFFALTFVLPVLVFELSTAIIISVIWGLLVVSVLSFEVAREERKKPWKVVGEHLFISIVVIIATHYVGDLVSLIFV